MAYVDEERGVTLDVPSFLGANTAQKPGGLAVGQWRSMKNAYQEELGDCTQRPGTIPVTGTALGAAVEHLTVYHANDKIIGASGTTLYKFDTGTGEWVALNGSLNQADIFDVDFTDTFDDPVKVRKIISDQGDLKEYIDSTETVQDITPAADDTSPAPANNLTAINALSPRFVWTFSSHVFVAFENSYDVWYSKRFTYDYFPTTQFLEWVNENDYINGCGISFNDLCLIPMRRHWGVLTGSTFDDFNGNQFLNTLAGVIAPRSIQRITYPNGTQTIVYLSDDGVHEIYDTTIQSTGSRQYSTKSLMKDKIDWEGLGLTDAEKAGAVGFFVPEWSLYLLKFNRGAERIVYAYDTRNGEWYTEWNNQKASGFVQTDEVYYAGETGHLHQYDKSLASDWDDSAKTTGSPIDFDVYTDVISLEDTGFQSYLDYFLAWSKQYPTTSTFDVYINRFADTDEFDKLIKSQYMVWGSGIWGEAVWYNINFTDLVGRPKRLPYKRRSFFFQIRFSNPRDELCKLYRLKLMGRVSGQ